MNLSLLIFCGLVSLAFSHVLPTEPSEKCGDKGPEDYCASATEAEKCRKTDFCEKYLKRHICDRGPAAYCKTLGSALTCRAEAYCLTWPDDSVKAVKIPTPPPVFDRIGNAIADGLGRIG